MRHISKFCEKKVAHCRFGAIKMSNQNNISTFSTLFFTKNGVLARRSRKFFFVPKIYQKIFLHECSLILRCRNIAIICKFFALALAPSALMQDQAG